MTTHDILVGWLIGMAIGVPVIIIGNILFRPELWGYFNIYKYQKNKIKIYMEKRNLSQKIKSLHSHPVTEQRDGIAKNKVLVDKEFEFLFNRVFTYWDEEHILVSRDEFNTIKKSGKPAPNYYDKILD